MTAPKNDDSRRSFLRFLAQSPLLYGLGGALTLERLGAQELSAESGLLINRLDEALNVFDFEAVMKSRIGAGHWAYMAQGADDSGTIAANRAAFAKIQLRPRRLVDVTKIHMSTELFGQRYDAPIFLAPVGAQGAFHPEGEVAVARAAKAKNALQILSTVANFSVDLPEATVAIQVSGSFGSRQEEAQRLGRLLRPKESGLSANFYTLVARDTVDQDFAQNRQRFLAEQGYSYTILDSHNLAA